MTQNVTRRGLLGIMGLGAGAAALNLSWSTMALAEGKDSVTIAWPSDVPSWDPCQRMQPDAQPIYKLVFEQPQIQDPDLTYVPSLFTECALAADGLSLTFRLREGVTFHDGTPLTAEDIRYNWLTRVQESLNGGNKLDMANTWRNITDITLDGDYAGTFHFSKSMPTAIQWLGFQANFVVPKAALQAGVEAFREKPIGTGPYKLVEYQINSRMVFERNEDYWGEKPAIKTIIVNVLKDPSARAAALQAGQADLTINIPVRETERLGKVAGLAAELNPVQRMILLQIRDDLAMTDENLRLALHHAIDKQALSKAFYANTAVPLSLPITPGAPGDSPDFTFAYDPQKAKEYLAKSGYGPDKPAKIRFASTNGHFPSDYDIARALVAMWKKVGIEAELDVIEYAKYFELSRGGQLPDVTLYSWENATADPEIGLGYMLNPDLSFAAWRAADPGERIRELFQTADYDTRIAGYKDVARHAVEIGATVPLLQSVQSLVRSEKLTYTKYKNGWILGQTMRWS